MARLADFEFAYREAVMNVETAVAKVKAMLSGESASLLKNGANMVAALSGAEIEAKDAEREAEEEAQEHEFQEKLAQKMEQQRAALARQEEELEKLQQETDKAAAARTVEEGDKAAESADGAQSAAQLEEELRHAQDEVQRIKDDIAALAAAGAGGQAEQMKLDLQEELRGAEARLTAAEARWALHERQVEEEEGQKRKEADVALATEAEHHLQLEQGEEERYLEERRQLQAQLQAQP